MLATIPQESEPHPLKWFVFEEGGWGVEMLRRLTLGVNPGVLLGFIFLLVLLFVTTPTFRQVTTMQNLLQQASINAIIATGMTGTPASSAIRATPVLPL